MAGGQWTTQNKVRPGVYINTQSTPQAPNIAGDRGIAALPLPLPWGETGMIQLNQESFQTEALAKIGFHATDPRIQHISACMEHARQLFIYRLNGEQAKKASAALEQFTITAAHGGARGNEIRVVVQENIDDAKLFDVITYFDYDEVDRQQIASVADFTANGFIELSGEGLEPTAGINLTGGEDGEVSLGDYAKALSAFEAISFDTLGIPTEEQEIKALAVAYVKRLRDDNGKKVAVVVTDYANADYEGVISLKNSIVTEDGLEVERRYFLCRITGMMASAANNQSLTHMTIPNAVDALPRLTHTEIEQALQNGELVITAEDDRVFIEQDINTLTTFTPTKGKMFAKNRVVRVLDSIANDTKRTFERTFIGKVDNNDDGRNLLKSALITYLEGLEGINAIQNFNPQSDITIHAGQDIDSVYVELYVQPVDSVEKIYLKVFAN